MSSLLPGDTKGAASPARGLGALTPDLVALPVADTSVELDFLHALEVVSELGVEMVGKDLEGGAVAMVSLSVKEPLGDVVVERARDDIINLVFLFNAELAGALVDVHLRDLASQNGESAADTFDGTNGVGDLDLSMNGSVLDTNDMPEVGDVLHHDRRALRGQPVRLTILLSVFNNNKMY